MKFAQVVVSAWCVVACCSIAARSHDPISIFPVDPFSNQKILPDTVLNGSAADPELKLIATPAEYESVSFVMRAREPLAAVKVEASDLVGSNGTISAQAIDIRYVKVWFQGNGAWWSPRYKKPLRPVLVPELLLKNPALIQVDSTEKKNTLRANLNGRPFEVDISSGNGREIDNVESNRAVAFHDAETLQPIDLAPKVNQQIWVNVLVPAGTAGGEYVGGLSIRSEGERLAVVPITVKVLPVPLVPSPLTYSLNYRGQLVDYKPSVSSELKSKKQLLSELKNIARHGIESPVVFQGNSNPTTKDILPAVRTPHMFSGYLEAYREAGLVGNELYFAGYGTGAFSRKQDIERLSRRVKKIVSQAENFGFRKVYFVGIDEAAGDRLRAQANSWRTVRKAGAYVFAANNKHDLLQATALPDVAVMARALNPAEAQTLRSRGVRVLSYNNPQTAVEDPSLYRRNYGFALIGAGYEGAMLYAYQHGFGSVWNDFDSLRFRDHCFAYPTSRGVIDTIAWEAMREAIDDVRYLATAQQLVASAIERGLPGAKAMDEILDDTLAEITVEGNWQPTTLRSRLIELIESVLAFD